MQKSKQGALWASPPATILFSSALSSLKLGCAETVTSVPIGWMINTLPVTFTTSGCLDRSIIDLWWSLRVLLWHLDNGSWGNLNKLTRLYKKSVWKLLITHHSFWEVAAPRTRLKLGLHDNNSKTQACSADFALQKNNLNLISVFNSL